MEAVSAEKSQIKDSQKVQRDYYKILQVGQSGKGKTYSFRNMNPETTGFINVENKPLPFKNNFKYHTRCLSYIEAYNALIDYAKDPNITSIIFDSLSAYFDLLVLECRKKFKGFDVWNNYNEEIGKLISLMKRVPKEIFVTAHYEILGIEGLQEKRVKVKGKEIEGVLEKDFTIVMYADSKVNEKGKPEFSFNLFEAGTSAKCPPDIFGEDIYSIPNDSAEILKKVVAFAS